MTLLTQDSRDDYLHNSRDIIIVKGSFTGTAAGLHPAPSLIYASPVIFPLAHTHRHHLQEVFTVCCYRTVSLARWAVYNKWMNGFLTTAQLAAVAVHKGISRGIYSEILSFSDLRSVWKNWELLQRQLDSPVLTMGKTLRFLNF